MSEADKQPRPPNAFANQGRPAFAEGGDRAKKAWAIVCTSGFGLFWVAALFLLAELFGPRNLTFWPAVLTGVGLAVGILGRVMMVRRSA
jgi:VIT1/CCC1 family predicted Fe2+/Mn2+ transporter